MEIKKILSVLLIVWLTLSVTYVANSQFQRRQQKKSNASFNQGVVDSLQKIIDETKGCEAVPVYENEKTLHFMRVDCLNK